MDHGTPTPVFTTPQVAKDGVLSFYPFLPERISAALPALRRFVDIFDSFSLLV